MSELLRATIALQDDSIHMLEAENKRLTAEKSEAIQAFAEQVRENERLTAELKATQENEQRLADANKPLLADNYRLQARVEKLEGVINRTYDLVKLGRYQMADNELRQAIAATEQGESDGFK